MKLELSISNDAELRAYIKDCIKGQLKSVSRDEIKDILHEVLVKKIGTQDIPSAQMLFKEEIAKMVKNELASQGWGAPSFIKTEASRLILSEIKKTLKE